MNIMNDRVIVNYSRQGTGSMVVFSVVALVFGIGVLLDDGKPELARYLIAGFFVCGGVFFIPYTIWKKWHHPRLMVTEEGISSQFPVRMPVIQWEELAVLSCLYMRGKFYLHVELSAKGYLAWTKRRRLSTRAYEQNTQPVPAFAISETHLQRNVNELLAQIQHTFAEEITRYHIQIRPFEI